MTKIKIVCYIIAASQLVLGAIYLLAPGAFIAWQGLTPIAPDTGYPLAMLAGRFLVYGVGMIIIAHQPVKYRVWLDGMIAIQLIDLLAGGYYTASGIVGIAESAIAMFDAALFIALLVWIRRDIVPSTSDAQAV
jgi:hypothetical protein